MSAHETVHSMLMGWRDNNRLLIRSHGTSDFQIEGIFTVPLNIDAYIQLAQSFQTAFPGWQLEHTLEEEREDYVKMLLHVSGVHTGILPNLIPHLPPIQPTGIHFQVADIPVEFFLRNNKVALEVGNEISQQKCLSLYEQLGATVAL